MAHGNEFKFSVRAGVSGPPSLWPLRGLSGSLPALRSPAVCQAQGGFRVFTHRIHHVALGLCRGPHGDPTEGPGVGGSWPAAGSFPVTQELMAPAWLEVGTVSGQVSLSHTGSEAGSKEGPEPRVPRPGPREQVSPSSVRDVLTRIASSHSKASACLEAS